jgi:uncharacterized RDD family membrane protein YckC
MLPSGAVWKSKNSANAFVLSSARRIGALWRRILAFLIDSVAILIAGSILGYVFFGLFMELGPAGRLVGYFVGFCYFAIVESSYGHGQSLGKRFLLLQVVDKDGSPLSIEKSAIRYTVFAIPWLLIAVALPISRTPSLMSLLLGGFIFGVGGATLYLMVFNRNTRQCVHDLAAGSYVAEAGSNGPVAACPVWKPHWFVAADIVLLAAFGGILMQRAKERGSTAQLFADARQVELLPGVQSASILRVTAQDRNSKGDGLLVQVRCTISNSDQEALASQIADSIVTTDPTIDQYGMLRIVLIRGYDIGIFRSSFSQTYSDTPGHWREQFFAVPPEEPAH